MIYREWWGWLVQVEETKGLRCVAYSGTKGADGN